MKKFFFILLFVFCASFWAHCIEIRGRVVDTTGEPVIGATVREKTGESSYGPGGAVTDMDGRFTIVISVGSKLEVSYIGMGTVTVGPFNMSDTIPDIVLWPEDPIL